MTHRQEEQQLQESTEIPILIPPNTPEWHMLELNGELLAPLQFADENSSISVLDNAKGVELGQVQLQNKSPVMILGSHQLKGKVETLKEPFCILEKEYIDEILHYKVVGVVTEKLLFNQYPKIIMR